MKFLHFACFVAVFIFAGQASACKRYVGPANFLNTPAAWGNDSGPIVDGFIDVSSAEGKLLKVEHGVDLSRYNQIDYQKFHDCGGRFAFVQMNPKYHKSFHEHAVGVEDKGATVIPYFFFRLPKALLRSSPLLTSDDSPESISKLRETYISAGKQSANEFLIDLRKFNENQGTQWPTESNLAGLSGKFIAFDVEERPLAKLTSSESKQFGRGYAAAACAWIRTVEAELGDVIPVIYTFPAIYGEYLTFAYPEDNSCLQGYPVWIARTFGNGGEALVNTENPGVVDKYVQRLCRVSGGNRCIVHQYTHRGVFMTVDNTEAGGVPPHFDLNRFYHSEIQQSRSGVQYVRAEDPFR